MRVLIVDDNTNFLTLMRTVLEGVGVGSVRTATNAAEGMVLLHQQSFDIVLADWHMAGQDGLEFIQSIRRLPDRRIADVAVVMISAHAEGNLRDKAMIAGADGFIEKPVAMRDLLATLSRVVAARRS